MSQHLGQNQGVNANGERVIKDFFIYEEDFDSLSAGATDTGTINIQADSDFVMQKLAYFADVNGAAQTDGNRVVPLVDIVITDSGSGRNLMESAVPIASLFGTGRLPFILPTPKLFLARTTITLNVANFSASTTYNLKFSMIGYKAFRLN